MKFEAVLFDLDGTLLDTLNDLKDSVNYALAQMGAPRRTADEVRAFVGNGVHKLIECAMPTPSAPEELARCLALFQAHYSHNLDNKTAPYPGVMELLRALKARGLKLGVVSNKFDGAVGPLCEKYFDGLIDEAAGEREGVRRKPAPDAALNVLNALNVPPERALYAGDSDVDIQTAANAGLMCLAVSWGFRPRESLIAAGAQYVVDRASQFLAEMERMERELRCDRQEIGSK